MARRVKSKKPEWDLNDPDQLSKFLPIPGWKSKKNNWLPNFICADEENNAVLIGCFIGDHGDFSLNKKAVVDGMESLESGHRKEIFVVLINYKRDENDYNSPLSCEDIVGFKPLRDVAEGLVVGPDKGKGRYEAFWWINEDFKVSNGRM